MDPKEIFAQSPTLAAANHAAAASGGNGAAGAAAAPLKSIDDYNQANPDAATAAKGATLSVKKPPIKCTIKPDGLATCLNKGCQKGYKVKENHPTACWYVNACPSLPCHPPTLPPSLPPFPLLFLVSVLPPFLFPFLLFPAYVLTHIHTNSSYPMQLSRLRPRLSRRGKVLVLLPRGGQIRL